jgi:electron transport complex protein RnfG
MRAPTSLAVSLALLTSAAATDARADDVYWTTKALLKDFFKTSDKVSYVKVEGAALARVEAKLGYHLSKPSYAVFVARSGDRVDGYAVMDEQMGQHQPITFGVKLDADGQVERMEVMVYREGYGDEIREGRFRHQFEGKGANDHLRFGEDVVAISGATISSKAMAIGVRRAVALVASARATPPQPMASAATGSGQRAAP